MASNTTPPGLIVLENFITPDEERELISHIDEREWFTPSSTGKGRRVQHYGVKYNYTARATSGASDSAPPIPSVFDHVLDRLEPQYGRRPQQVIVNEYKRNQGIGAHIDVVKSFGPIITTVSLGDEAVMIFENKQSHEIIEVPLRPRSAVLMTGDSRYIWTHKISSNIGYVIDGERRSRGKKWRRISLTLRTLA
jgi:alkylated DNA repair protein alkB family protein 8